MATFKELQDQVLRQLRDQAGYMRAAVKDAIRWTLDDLADRGDFPWWHAEATFATDSFYSTGRCSVKSDKMQLSGSATAWKKLVAGSKIVFSASAPDSSANWYRIDNRPSKTRANMTAPFRGASKTRKKYCVFRDEYPLRYDVDRILRIRYLSKPDKMVDAGPREIYEYDPNPARCGNPEIYRVVGVTDKALWDSKSASFVANSRVVTGTSTVSWDVSMVGKALRNQNEGRIYEIVSAPSTNSFRIKDAYAGSFAGKKKYEIDPPGTPVIQLYPIPTTKQHYVYEYQRVPRLPYANNDVPDLPAKHHEILVWGALVRCHMQMGAVVDDKTFAQAEKIYYSFTPQKMAAKAKMTSDRIMRMGSWDRGGRWESGRMDPSRWRYPH